MSVHDSIFVFFLCLNQLLFIQGSSSLHVEDNDYLQPVDASIVHSNHTTTNAEQPLHNTEWDISYTSDLYSPRCNIERRFDLTDDEFFNDYHDKKPVILLSNQQDNTEFQNLCTKSSLLRLYSNYTVRLSTANTHSYDKHDLLFKDYVDMYVESPQTLEKDGLSTLYLFGDNNWSQFKVLFDAYVTPKYGQLNLLGALSWGLAASGTGVPFHTHGAVFAEVIHGHKRWFLYPPEHTPSFDPNQSTLQWIHTVYPTLDLENEPLYECVLGPNEVLFLPSQWWHATLNLGICCKILDC